MTGSNVEDTEDGGKVETQAVVFDFSFFCAMTVTMVGSARGKGRGLHYFSRTVLHFQSGFIKARTTKQFVFNNPVCNMKHPAVYPLASIC